MRHKRREGESGALTLGQALATRVGWFSGTAPRTQYRRVLLTTESTSRVPHAAVDEITVSPWRSTRCAAAIAQAFGQDPENSGFPLVVALGP